MPGEQAEPPTGHADAGELRRDRGVVGRKHRPEARGHRVEAAVVEGHRLGVADDELHLDAGVVGARARPFDQVGREVEAGHSAPPRRAHGDSPAPVATSSHRSPRAARPPAADGRGRSSGAPRSARRGRSPRRLCVFVFSSSKAIELPSFVPPETASQPIPIREGGSARALARRQLGEHLLRPRRDLVIDLELIALGLHRLDRGGNRDGLPAFACPIAPKIAPKMIPARARRGRRRGTSSPRRRARTASRTAGRPSPPGRRRAVPPARWSAARRSARPSSARCRRSPPARPESRCRRGSRRHAPPPGSSDRRRRSSAPRAVGPEASMARSMDALRRDPRVQVVVVVDERNHDARRALQRQARPDVDLSRPPRRSGRRAPAPAGGRPGRRPRWPLAPVEPRVVDVDVEAVLVRGVPDASTDSVPK